MRIRAKGPNHLPGRMPWQISEAGGLLPLQTGGPYVRDG